MRESDARALVAVILANWPRADWPEPTRAAYSEALLDFDADEVQLAIRRAVAVSPFPPAIAELRRAIVERRLDLPTEVEAWERAVAAAAARRDPPLRVCIACAGDGVDLDHEICSECRGSGNLGVDVDRLPPTPEPIPRAVRFVGGWRAIRETETLDLKRRDFLAAYRTMRAEEVERENLRLLGANGDHPLVESAARAAIEAGR